MILFDTAAASNVDHITGFNVPTAIMRLASAVYGAAGIGVLSAAAFHGGTAAAAADDRIIYDQATGSKFFDADGVGGVVQTLFAVLDNRPVALTAADFVSI